MSALPVNSGTKVHNNGGCAECQTSEREPASRRCAADDAWARKANAKTEEGKASRAVAMSIIGALSGRHDPEHAGLEEMPMVAMMIEPDVNPQKGWARIGFRRLGAAVMRRYPAARTRLHPSTADMQQPHRQFPIWRQTWTSSISVAQKKKSLESSSQFKPADRGSSRAQRRL
jgi:hypothetical protein